MNVLAAILILGASGTATRTIVVEDSIAAIVGRVILGGLQDVSASRNNDRDARRVQGVGELAKAARDLYEHVGQISLRIDGEPRTGWAWGVAAVRVAGYVLGRQLIGGVQDVVVGRSHGKNWSAARIYAAVEKADIRLRIDGEPRAGWAWGVAAARVAGYVLDRQSSGPVEYEYRLPIRDLDIRRATTIEDNRVSLVTDVYGQIGPRGELYAIRLTIVAVEGADGTRITGVATGYSEIGRRCRLVNRIASRVIADAMGRELLATIQAGGTDWYRAGSVAEVLR